MRLQSAQAHFLWREVEAPGAQLGGGHLERNPGRGRVLEEHGNGTTGERLLRRGSEAPLSTRFMSFAWAKKLLDFAGCEVGDG